MCLAGALAVMVGAVFGSLGSVASAAASSGSKATGTPIPVGNIGGYTGVAASSYQAAKLTVQAWADSVNASGGINGHPVKLYIEDDGGDPTTALSEVKTLIQQDHVVAIVGDFTTTDGTWGSYAATQGVPVVGGESLNAPYWTAPDFFPDGANVIALQYGVLATAKQKGSKFAELYCSESPQCAGVVPTFQAMEASTGVKLVYSSAVSATAPDYTAVCQAVKASGAQSWGIADAAVAIQRIAGACAQQGVKLPLIELDTFNANFAGQPGSEGSLVVNSNFPWTDSSVPATKAYQAAMKKYAPSLYSQNLMDENSPEQWAAGVLFATAVKASGSSTVTAASVKKGLYSLKNNTLGGLAPPLTYTKGKATHINCYFTMGVSGGKPVAPIGLKTNCAPNGLVSTVITKLVG